jgi:hypothetical protein
VIVRHPLVTATKWRSAYCPFCCNANRFGPNGHTMMMDFYNLSQPFLCQLSKSAPNILWSVGSSVHNQFLQVGYGNPAVMAARMSLKSFLNGRAGKMPAAARIAQHAMSPRSRAHR